MSGASFTGPIYTNSNINFTGSGILKYPSGTAGQVLVSDATGLLTLGSLPSGYPTLVYGYRVSPNPTWLSIDSGKVKSVFYIDLNPGTYLVNYKIGVQSLNYTLQISYFYSAMSTSFNSSAGDIPATSHNHSYGVGNGLLLSRDFTNGLPISNSIVINTNATATRYYVNTQITCIGSHLISILAVSDYTTSTLSNSHIYAIKIA